MGFYQDHIVPVLINLAMRRQELVAYRSHVIPAAEGRVLEIGVGSGLNLPFYSRNVERLVGLDPSPKLLSMVRRNLKRNASPVELIEGSAEAIPLKTNSVDTVVTTWTLCSIPDADRALREMHQEHRRGAPKRSARSGPSWRRPISTRKPRRMWSRWRVSLKRPADALASVRKFNACSYWDAIKDDSDEKGRS